MLRGKRPNVVIATKGGAEKAGDGTTRLLFRPNYLLKVTDMDRERGEQILAR
ncbi:hypothetical protein [Brevibacillus formosus]|uniref:hypothetical protein n=1 Tax=Brevibacillus formosus TaxID=54913 RepID=UPI003F1D6A9A